MKNMLRQMVSREEFRNVFRERPPVSVLPAEGDRAWAEAGSKPDLQRSLAELFSLAEREAGSPLPELTDALYADYAATGVRLNFERLYFERRRRLARAAMAALLERDPGRREVFGESLRRKAGEIFDEISWALPAHVKESTGKNALTTDLFAAETANTFAELLALFPGTLSAEFRGRVQDRLRKEFFENYLVQNSMWLKATHNWNAVCHQGVLGAALAVESDAELLADMFVRAADSLPNFLKSYTDDGATSEGPAYWSYGFGWFTELNAQLEKRTGGAFSVFDGDPLVGRIARFGPAMVLRNGNVVNFSDASPRGSVRAATVEYLAQRLRVPVLKAYAQNAWNGLSEDVQGQRSDLFMWTRLALRCPAEAATLVVLDVQDLYYPGVGWAVVRSHDDHGHAWEFAAKAGHNAENHNHNDVGSFLLNVDGQRLLLEIGAPEYVKDFFRHETRYGFLAARSLGHSVPLINGVEQSNGAEFCGTVTEQRFSEKEAVFAVDFTKAYPAKAGLVKGVRRFHLDKAAGVLNVSDVFELSSSGVLETAIIAAADTRMEGKLALVRAGNVALRITPRAGTVIREVQAHEYKTHDGSAAQVKRIVLSPEHLETHVTLAYSVEVAGS